MSDETKIFTKNDKNGDKCASGGQESGLKLIFERGVAILVRPWRFPGQPKKFVFFSIKVGTINSGTSLDSREQFKKTGKLEFFYFLAIELEEAAERIEELLSFDEKLNPFVMPYRDLKGDGSVVDKRLNDLARWCNVVSVRKSCSFRDYQKNTRKGHENTSPTQESYLL